MPVTAPELVVLPDVLVAPAEPAVVGPDDAGPAAAVGLATADAADAGASISAAVPLLKSDIEIAPSATRPKSSR